MNAPSVYPTPGTRAIDRKLEREAARFTRRLKPSFWDDPCVEALSLVDMGRISRFEKLLLLHGEEGVLTVPLTILKRDLRFRTMERCEAWIQKMRDYRVLRPDALAFRDWCYTSAAQEEPEPSVPNWRRPSDTPDAWRERKARERAAKNGHSEPAAEAVVMQPISPDVTTPEATFFADVTRDVTTDSRAGASASDQIESIRSESMDSLNQNRSDRIRSDAREPTAPQSESGAHSPSAQTLPPPLDDLLADAEAWTPEEIRTALARMKGRKVEHPLVYLRTTLASVRREIAAQQALLQATSPPKPARGSPIPKEEPCKYKPPIETMRQRLNSKGQSRDGT